MPPVKSAECRSRAHTAACCAVGACVGTLLAWWLPASWRLLTFLAGLFCLAYIPTWSLVVESPQWLLLHGKKVSCGHERAGGRGRVS